MRQDDLRKKPYELLGYLEQDAPLAGLAKENVEPGESDSLKLITAYITTMYYAALANLYMQGTLPTSLEEVDAENPRLKIAFNRSYADFMTAKEWLTKNGADLIASSTAKSYYDEVSGMEESMIKNIELFYS